METSGSIPRRFSPQLDRPACGQPRECCRLPEMPRFAVKSELLGSVPPRSPFPVPCCPFDVRPSPLPLPVGTGSTPSAILPFDFYWNIKDRVEPVPTCRYPCSTPSPFSSFTAPHNTRPIPVWLSRLPSPPLPPRSAPTPVHRTMPAPASTRHPAGRRPCHALHDFCLRRRWPAVDERSA
jgi:hypothetical protein